MKQVHYSKKSNILKFEDKILIGNITLISESIINLLPPIFKKWFIFCSEIRNYDTVSLSADKLFKPSDRTDPFEWNSKHARGSQLVTNTNNLLKY